MQINSWLLLVFIMCFSASSDVLLSNEKRVYPYESLSKSELMAPLYLDRGFIWIRGAEEAKKFIDENGRVQLTFEVNEHYPAEALTTELVKAYDNQSWIRIRSSFPNPKQDISDSEIVESKWTRYIDATTPQKKMVYQWMAKWRDEKRNIISYMLEYSRDFDKSDDVLSALDKNPEELEQLTIVVRWYSCEWLKKVYPDIDY